MKKIYFLAGYSRSGNTLLSCILNQNKKIAVTPNSCVSTIMYNLNKMHDSEFIRNLPETSGIDNVIKKLFQNYFENLEAEIIFDRSSWGTVPNLNMLKKYKIEPKFILLVRPLVEVLASFVKISKCENVREFVEKMMSPISGKVYKDWLSTKNIIETKQNYLLIKYDDLVNNTEININRIYNYFNIQKFKHTYSNLKQFEFNGVKYNDTIYGYSNLHFVRPNVEKQNYDIEEYLPKDIIKKYSEWDFL
jgi:hypothetical protein